MYNVELQYKDFKGVVSTSDRQHADQCMVGLIQSLRFKYEDVADNAMTVYFNKLRNEDSVYYVKGGLCLIIKEG